jgi:hypothetical protein
METDSEQLLETAKKSHDILFKATTVFPFTLFPDTITIDREKVTIANRFFFQVAKITSSPVNDIQSVEANVGPFFGSVRLTSRFFYRNIRIVKYLWRADALKIQRIVQGYIIVSQKEIDCSNIDKDKLVALLLDLGRGSTD